MLLTQYLLLILWIVVIYNIALLVGYLKVDSQSVHFQSELDKYKKLYQEALEVNEELNSLLNNNTKSLMCAFNVCDELSHKLSMNDLSDSNKYGIDDDVLYLTWFIKKLSLEIKPFVYRSLFHSQIERLNALPNPYPLYYRTLAEEGGIA